MKEVEESLQKFKEAHDMLAEGSDAVRNEVEETTELADEVARKSMTADITAPVRKEAVTKAADIARKEEKPVKEHELETLCTDGTALTRPLTGIQKTPHYLSGCRRHSSLGLL